MFDVASKYKNEKLSQETDSAVEHLRLLALINQASEASGPNLKEFDRSRGHRDLSSFSSLSRDMMLG